MVTAIDCRLRQAEVQSDQVRFLRTQEQHLEVICSFADCILATMVNLTLKSWIRQKAQSILAPLVVKTLVFKNDKNREDLSGWHTAPRRQWCITLSGSVEIGIGNGTVKTFGPGDVFLAEDTTGRAIPPSRKTARAFAHLD